MQIIQMYGGGLLWWYLVTKEPFKVIMASDENDKERMQLMRRLLDVNKDSITIT